MSLHCSRALWVSLHRPLSSLTLLETVRSDPGMSASYYANRYFGTEKAAEVSHVLWYHLKRSGKVVLERREGQGEPIWNPVLASPRIHHATKHRFEDEDLSLLKQEK